ncbi:MAG: hypothetical protein WA085_13325 [Sphingobium sp.]
MQTTFFEDAAIKNRVHCDSLGLPSDVYQRPLSDLESNGVPLSADEIEIADYMTRHGLNRQAAESFVDLHKIPGPVAKMGPPKMLMHHTIVEYARPVTMWDKQNITPFYEDQRAKYQQRAGVWVGD